MQPLKKAKTYSVHSLFLTLQGEGLFSGRRAVFCRFVGCNVWSGFEEHRRRDAKNSSCSLICDTEFNVVRKELGGGRFTAGELVRLCFKVWDQEKEPPFIVFTGGEPGLQLDEDLCRWLKAEGCFLAVETNGSVALPASLDWVSCSPKPPLPLALEAVSELKLLSCFLDHAESYRHLSSVRWVSPVDYQDEEANQEELRKCLKFIEANAGWGLSAQLHKVLGIP